MARQSSGLTTSVIRRCSQVRPESWLTETLALMMPRSSSSFP